MNWNEANSICSALGMRLPTEAEFEYAARGKSGKDKFATSTGQLKDAQGKLLARYFGRDTGNVKEFSPNSYGLYGLSGNVWKWVSDWYGPYSSEAVTNPQGPMSGIRKVMRGELSYTIDMYVTTVIRDFHVPAVIRNSEDPSVRDDKLGFRCVAP